MIKIIKGSYGMRVGELIKRVKAGQCCELTEAEEARLVRIGVAETVEVVKADTKPKEQGKAAAKPKAKTAAGAAAKTRAPAEQAEPDADPLPGMQGADAVVG